MRLPTAEATHLEWALYYLLEMNWAVIPLEPGTKKPYVKWKPYQTHLPTKKDIETWFGDLWPDADLGIICGLVSKLLALDIDSIAALAQIQEKYGNLPGTPREKTSQGWHFYFFEERRFHSKTFFKGCEAKAEGTLAVVFPSKGKKWQILPTKAKLLSTPDWLALELTLKGEEATLTDKGTKEGSFSQKELDRLMRGVEVGERNEAATKIAGHFIGIDCPRKVVLERLATWNKRNKNTKGEPCPLPNIELTKIVDGFFGKKEEKKEEKRVVAPEKKERIFMTGLQLVKEEIPELPAPIGGGLLVPERYTILAASDWEGKTTLCTHLTLNAITGTKFLNIFDIPAPVKVLYFCGENSRGDVKAKVLLQLTEIEKIMGRGIEEELKRNLVIVEPININFSLDPRGISELHGWLEDHSPNIVIFDPLSDFISASRSLSDDTLARTTAKTLTKIAREYHCFPILVTHFKKEAINPNTGRSIVTVDNVWNFVHGSKFWLNPAAAQIAVIRANLQRYPKAKKLVFKFKTVEPIEPLQIMRNRNLFYEELPSDQMNLASLTDGDVRDVLERRCGGMQVESVLIDTVRKDFKCSRTVARELLRTALLTKLLYRDKVDGLIKISP